MRRRPSSTAVPETALALARRLVRLMAVVAAMTTAGCAGLPIPDLPLPGDGEEPAAPAAEAPKPARDAADAAEGVPYQVVIQGAENAALRAALLEASRLVELQDDPPVTVRGLQRRAEQDAERLARVLRSRGHYAGTVQAEVDADVEPARVTLRVEPGPVYTLSAFEIEYRNPAVADAVGAPRGMENVGLEQGQPARAEAVLEAVESVPEQLSNIGYPFARVEDYTATVDHAERTMRVVVEVDAGERAVFGVTSIEGLETVEQEYVRMRIPWTVGVLYDRRALQQMRRNLLETGLFRSVDVEPAETVTEAGTLPIDVEVEEADHRSLGASIRYSSSIGPAAGIFWEHRNLLGRNEDFRAELEASQLAQTFEVNFLRPDFLRLDQQFAANAAVAHEEFEAYDRDSIVAEVDLIRPLTETWTVSAGALAEYAVIADEQGETRSTLVGLPFSARRDTTESVLDPREGTRLNFFVTPFTGDYQGPVTFLRNLAETIVYVPLTEDRARVLAGRLALGSILGASRTEIPADKRFYAGGGGSVRGYGFQKAGELDAQNDPLGGQSLFEVGLELRYRITETIGLVPFIEGGRAFLDEVPDPTKRLFWGVGLGVRYFSPVGPVRFDVALPVDPRDDIDDAYQIYISLGQAF